MSLKHSRNERRGQQGFTLVEILVAVAISLFLLAGILQVMSSNKQTARFQEAVARIQENARFALMFLGRDFRQAGYMGCAGTGFTNQLVLDNNEKDFAYNLLNPVAGWEANNTEPTTNFTINNTAAALSDWNSNPAASIDPSLAGQLMQGSDIVIVKYVQQNNPGITADGATPVTAASIPLVDATGTSASSGVPQDSIILISDCINADLFRSTNAATASTLARGNLASQDPNNQTVAASNWSHAYNGNMKIMQLVSNIYYVGVGNYGGPSLFRANFNTGPMTTGQELVEGVENMQILYGEDTTGNSLADQYITMNEVTNMANIVTVRVSMLMRSIESVKVAGATTVKLINGVSVSSMNDRNIRFVVTSTFKIRNRGVL